jgi:hypothetical protein
VISYPALGTTHTTHSFLLAVEDVSARVARLRIFGDEFHEVFGLHLDDFLRMCERLTSAIVHQNALLELDEARETRRGLVCTSGLRPREPRAGTAPRHLLTIMSEGVLRAPPAAWRTTLGGEEDVADAFLTRFTATAGHNATDLAPALFHDLEPNSLVLDLLRLDDFFDLCLLSILAGRDGAAGKTKGKLFEQDARRTLTEGLGLSSSDSPAVPNPKLDNLGLGAGKIDFCFVKDTTLMHVQMKSWSRSAAYQRQVHSDPEPDFPAARGFGPERRLYAAAARPATRRRLGGDFPVRAGPRVRTTGPVLPHRTNTASPHTGRDRPDDHVQHHLAGDRRRWTMPRDKKWSSCPLFVTTASDFRHGALSR